MADEIKEAQDIQKTIETQTEEAKTTFSESALDKMISDLKDENADVVPEDFEFGEKKVDKKKLAAKTIRYIAAGVCLLVFIVWGVAMEVAQREFDVKLAEIIPAWVHILVMLGSLFATSVIANFFGGEENKERQAKEEE